MKKIISFLLTVSMLITALSACAADMNNTTILLQIGSTQMQVNGQTQELDSEPVIVNDRTLVPIRAIIEAMGGTVLWEQDTQTATLNYGDDEIKLIIDNETAYLNDAPNVLDTAPIVINDRTMLPIRFIAESFDFDVEWDNEIQEITIKKLTDINNSGENNMNDEIKIKIGDKTLTATLAENSSAAALKELLSENDITINMSDYGNFEKVGSLGTSLPRNDEHITTEPGDLILYQGNNITIYYDTNTWNFTRLGKIDNVTQTELKQILGSGDVTVTLSLK